MADVRNLHEEQHLVHDIVKGNSVEPRILERARIVSLWCKGFKIRSICEEVGVSRSTAVKWIRRFGSEGIEGLNDEPRSGRPIQYGSDCIALLVEIVSTDPISLGFPCRTWSLRNLERYLNEHRAVSIKRNRINTLLRDHGYQWKQGSKGTSSTSRWVRVADEKRSHE